MEPAVVLFLKDVRSKIAVFVKDLKPLQTKKVSKPNNLNPSNNLITKDLLLYVDKEDASSSSDEETSSAVVRPTKRKSKVNPNIQMTSRLEKKQKTTTNSGSDSDEVTVSYKSKRSAMPEGPQDQGATAVLVC